VYLQIPRLRNQPFVYELLRVFGETQEKFPTDLQLIDILHRLVDFVVEALKEDDSSVHRSNSLARAE